MATNKTALATQAVSGSRPKATRVRGSGKPDFATKTFAVEAKHRSGPAQEKTQITLRLDKTLMNAVVKLNKEENSRITDVVERGLILALAEAEYLPKLTNRARFVVNNATRDEERKVLGLAARMKEPEVRKDKMSELEAKVIELFDWWLDTGLKLDWTQDALDLYARYGRSPEETAKLRA